MDRCSVSFVFLGYSESYISRYSAFAYDPFLGLTPFIFCSLYLALLVHGTHAFLACFFLFFLMTNLFLNFDLHLQNLFDPSKFHTLADSVFSSGQSLEFTLLVLFFSAIFSMYLILYIGFCPWGSGGLYLAEK
jgi:ABC-type enterochelin transport system permease subunit